MDDPAERRLARGDVLVASHPVAGSRWPRLVARAVLPASPEAAWRLIEGVARWPEFMPGVAACEALAPDGAVLRTRMVVHLPFPFRDLSAIVRARHAVTATPGGARFERTWTLESGDYAANDGRWTLAPFAPDATAALATYELHAAPRLPLPRWLATALQERAMPALFEALRTRLRAVAARPSPGG